MRQSLKIMIILAVVAAASWAFAFQAPASGAVAYKLANPVLNENGGVLYYECILGCRGGDACCCLSSSGC